MAGLFVLCGLVVGAGVWLVVTGARRMERPDRPSTRARLRDKLTGSAGYRLAAAVAVAVVVAAVTRWPVAALLAALFTYAAPSLLGGGRVEAASLAKLEAIASWTEALRGSLRSYAGIEQAIKDTTALRKAAASHTGNLAAQLGWLAHAVRERVAAMQRVETARTEAKTSARLVIIIVVVVGVGLYVFNRPLLAPYGSPTGQVVLLLVGAIWTLAAVWLQKLTRMPEPTRVLKDDPETRTP